MGGALVKATSYSYNIPNMKSYIPGSASNVSIQFIPELYNSHFLERFTDRMKYREPIAMDIETTGLKIGADDFETRMIQVGTKNEAWCIPQSEDNIELIYDALLRGTCKIITHGGVYDWTALMVEFGQAEIDPERLVDTKILAHHWDTRTKDPYTKAPGHSMDALIRLRIAESVAEEIKTGPTKRAGELGITKQEYFKSVPLDDKQYVMYAGMDVVCTYLIYESLMADLNRSIQRGVHSAELIRTDHEDMLNCILMGARGMKVNREYFEKLGAEYDKIYLERKAEAKEKFGVTALGSTKQLAAVFEEQGHPVAKYTDKGNPKVDAIELRRQADRGSELAEIVMEGKKVQKWSSTFVTGILEASSAQDRIHPKFDPLGARTSRYSSSEPNMQNLPGRVDDIRMGLEVDYPDLETGVSLDYQSQELRLLAATSQDPQLCEDLMSGKKPVKILAVRIYGPGADNDEIKYGRTKNTVYASLYGAGPRKLADTAGISIEESKAVLNELYEMYPETKTYSNHLMGLAAKQGYIKNLAGRLIIVDPNKPYTALNYMLQSTGRELIAAAIRDIMKSRWGRMLRLVVHDEIVTVCPTNLVDQMIPEVSEMMNTNINGMEFPAGAEVWGKQWQGHKS